VLLVSGPVLLVSMVVGLVISLFQAVTQIQEFTLTFVPKIIAVFITLFLFFPWIARIMMTYTIELFTKIPTYIR
jgi:flagellar biosynthetic protein FliQ